MRLLSCKIIISLSIVFNLFILKKTIGTVNIYGLEHRVIDSELRGTRSDSVIIAAESTVQGQLFKLKFLINYVMAFSHWNTESDPGVCICFLNTLTNLSYPIYSNLFFFFFFQFECASL